MNFFCKACILLVLLGLCSACNVTKHLDAAKGQRLLVKNTLELKAERKIRLSERTPLLYELAAFYKQKPNRKVLGLFRTRLALYYKYQYRTKGFARWINKSVGEPPTIYSQELTARTARNFEYQLQLRGYLNAHATYKVDSIGARKIAVHYTLNFGPLYTIESVRFISRDSLILQILQFTKSESNLKPGAPLTGASFDAEKLRITSELKNRGYAYFAPNFVQFSGDSIGTRIKVTLEVLTPGDSLQHKTYTIKEIQVFPSLVPEISSLRQDTTISGIYFATSEAKFRIKPKYLYKAIAFRPDWPYRQVDFDKTARNLNALGVFRFVSIRPVRDSSQDDRMNVVISLTPNKRISRSWDADINSSNSAGSLAGSLIGASTSAAFGILNLFHGAERLQSSALFSLEFNPNKNIDKFIFSKEFKFQNELILPRFFDYLGVWRGLHNFKIGRNRRIVGAALYERLKTDAQARISLNYNFLQVTDFYQYNLFNASFGYEMRTSQEHQYAIDHIGIDVLRPKFVDPTLADNIFLQKSFGPQLFTGFLLRSFNYNYASRPNGFGERWTYRLNTELSGLEEAVVNRLWAIPFGKQNWTISDLEFAHFLRVDMDGVYTRDFTDKVTGAVRIGSGAAFAFGETKNVPFVKQFYIGGPSSLRAWRIREIGPGGYRDEESSKEPPFFQASDFRFEFNGELRFPLFSWFKGAVFVDGGNIWSLDRYDTRDRARLWWDSYKNIALGTGMGLRLDFSYAIIRLDWGLKLRTPYANEQGKYWVPNIISKFQLRDFATNLSIGYPF